MGRMETFAPVPPAAISRVLATFDRDQLAGFIAVAIDLLDLADGEADLEDGGDEELTGEERDIAWPEWHTRSRRQRNSGPEMADTAGYGGDLGTTEDDEEDDPSGVCDEDGINTEFAAARSREPGCSISDIDHGQDDIGEDDPCRESFPAYAIDQTRPLDPDLANACEISAPFRDRVRREQCKPYTNSWGETAWRLPPPPGTIIIHS